MTASILRIAFLLCLLSSVAPAADFETRDEETACTGCGKKIEVDSWIKVDGDDYHPECFQCAKCGGSIGNDSYYRHGGLYYHHSCYLDHLAPRCDLCGKVLEGTAIVDFFGNRYCAFHEGVEPRCECCRRFISDDHTGGGRQYDDGRQTCNLCLHSAIFTSDDGLALLDSIRDNLQTFGICIEGKVRLRLINQTELRQRSEGLLSDPQGVATYRKETSSSGAVVRADFEIFSLRGLPRLSLTSVLAHELMHIWLFQNAAADIDPALCEGACNYVSYLVLAEDDTEYAAMLLDKLQRDVSPIYGDGYRETARYVSRVGIERWLEYLKKSLNPPW